MKIKFLTFAFLATIVLSLSSCKSREEKVISQLDNLAERIEKHGKDFDAEDWEEALEDLEEIHENMEDCDFSKKELRELGRKEGKLFAIITREGAKALGRGAANFLGEFGAFAKGFKEGAEDNISEKDLKEVEEDISDSFKSLEEEFKE